MMNNSWGVSFYYLCYLLIGSLFLMQLFTGVIFMKFDEKQKEERKKGRGAVLTAAQQRWIEMQRIIVSAKPDFFLTPPDNVFRKMAFRIAREWGNGTYLDLFVLAVIIANIISMAMHYEGSTTSFTNRLTTVSYVVTGVFIAEAVIKLAAVGFQFYWKDGWNRLDVIVIVASVVDIIVGVLGTDVTFLRVGPQLVQIFRVLRILRLLKILRNFRGIQKILWVIYLSLPAILNQLALLFLAFFIFTLLAVYLFQGVVQGITISPYRGNFSNFGNALLTLFRCSTGEDWYKVMYDTWHPMLCSDGTQDCGQRKSLFIEI
mgnify:CR=1 FL=1